jgi:general secretion pathway protein D
VTFIDKDIKAAINALGSKTTVEVVSAPKIMALDNHPARLEVGDQVPIIVQTQQSTTSANAALVNSVDYRNTGVILNVTPRIAGDDRIALSITQEVSSVAPTTTSGIDSPTIQQRKFDSALLLADGGTVALGGLISSTRTKGGAGVPYLQKIPFAGALFDRHTDSLQKTELIILLSAKIIRDQAASSRVMADLLADMNDASMRGLVNARR